MPVVVGTVPDGTAEAMPHEAITPEPAYAAGTAQWQDAIAAPSTAIA